MATCKNTRHRWHLVPTLRVGTRYLAAPRCHSGEPDAERPRRAFPRGAWERGHNSPRTGGVYIAVLGTSLIVALLGMTALMGQRIQNRMLSASTDMRQAQLNANSAVELALLAMKQDVNWRTNYTNGNWFTNRGTNTGSCTASVTDPIDSNLANSPDDPVVVLGIGYSGKAEQRVEVTIDPRKEPLSCLRSAIAAEDISLANDTLRTDGLISANTADATSSQVYGRVEAVSISGSTYHGTTAAIQANERPTMPDWSTVFDYYRTNGTEISIASLPTTTGDPPGYLGRNVGIESTVSVANDPNWTGTPPNIPTADVSQSNNWSHSGTYSLRVQNRSAFTAGAAQPIDAYVKPGQQYYVEAWVNVTSLLAARTYRVTLYTKGTGNAIPLFDLGPTGVVLSVAGIGVQVQIAGTVTAPAWSGELEYAFVKIAGADLSNVGDFYVDDFAIRETTTGRFIYRRAISPSLNPFGITNAQGIYKIDCGGQKLVIERSRILGTLLVVNPGSGSCIANGPIHMSPTVSGYPVLLVENNTFAINATNRALSEKENDANFHPTGTAVSEFDPTKPGDKTDIYPSEIRGLVVIEDDLTYANRALIRGQIVVGDYIANSSGELEVDFQPDSLLNPPPGFLAPYSHLRRPASTRKVVLP